MTPADVRTRAELQWREMHRETVRTIPGGWIDERPGRLLCGAPGSSECVALLTGPIPPDALLEATEQAFARKGGPVAGFFVVRLAAGGPAEATADALVGRGFCELHRQPHLVLTPAEHRPGAAPPGLTIRPVTDDGGRRAFAVVVTAAWRIHLAPYESLATANFATLACVVGAHRQAFVGWVDGRPVAAAVLHLSHDVAGVGWVATHPSAERRGYARALTSAVVTEGFRRGARVAALQASAMGEPVYRRLGFRTIGHCRELIREDLYQAFLPA